MNNDIKEILERIGKYVITPDVEDDFNNLKDYITNLQEEKDKEIERLNNIINKAIEYIKLVATDHDIMNNNEIIYTQMQYEEIENLLDILQGSDK